MRLLHLHPGPDTAGQSAAAKRVLEAGGDEVRVFAHRQHPFAYGKVDLWDEEAVRESVQWADVIVIHNDPLLAERVGAVGGPAELFVHHHGTRFRTHPDAIWRQCRDIGARSIVSTVDLLLSVPKGGEAQWIPQVIDTRKMEALREALAPAPTDRPVVAHAPTNRMTKGTRYVNVAMQKIGRDRRVDYLLIQRRPWTVCLTLKASSHVFVDQLHLGYGNNAIEAWAMRLPVIAGAPEPILAKMREVYGGYLPFLSTAPNEVEGAIRALIDSPDLREEWGRIGYEHVQRFHAPETWADYAHRLYAGILTEASPAA